MISAVVTGIAELDEKLKYMHTQAANKIARATVRTGLAAAARNIRRHIKPNIAPKTADKGIGYSLKKQASGAVGKAGVGVGGAYKNALNVKNRAGRKGVGVSARNLHWFALGTQKRFTGQGRMTRRNAVFRKQSGKLAGASGKKHYTGYINKSKFGGFVQGFGAADVQRRMEERFRVLIQKAAAGGVSGAEEVAEM